MARVCGQLEGCSWVRRLRGMTSRVRRAVCTGDARKRYMAHQERNKRQGESDEQKLAAGQIRHSGPYRLARTMYRTFRPVPVRRPAPPLSSAVYPLAIPLPPDEESGFKSCGLFDGYTRGLRHLDCHVSVLTTAVARIHRTLMKRRRS